MFTKYAQEGPSCRLISQSGNTAGQAVLVQIILHSTEEEVDIRQDMVTNVKGQLCSHVLSVQMCFLWEVQ